MRRIAAVSALLACLVLVAAPGASARDDSDDDALAGIARILDGLLPGATADSCEAPLLENPFAFAGDLLDYVLAPGGSFEGRGGGDWLLDGGAGVEAGNDPFPIRPDGVDANVLSIPEGASGASAPMCVDLDYPHFRLAVQQMARDDGKLRGRLKVETLYPQAANPRWRKVDVIRPGTDEWVLSDFLDLEPERGGSEPGARTVSLRFTALGNGPGFRIDDVYVDPRRKT